VLKLAAEYPSLGSERRLLQKRAFGFLISSYWLTGEAALDGRAVSGRLVQARLRARVRSYEIRAYSRGLRSVEDALEKELFSAKLNVIGGPVAVAPHDFVFEVTKIAAGYELPLSRVAASTGRC
jgi:hypothetical protein